MDYSLPTQPYYWYADDRGVGDYVLLAFATFGARTAALYDFYMSVFGLSLALLLLAYRNDKLALLLVSIYLITFFVCIPLWRLTNLVNMSAINISESRMFSLLAALPILHFVWLAFRGSESMSKMEWGAAFGQFAILAFLIHCRSTLKVEVVILAASLLVAAAWQLWRRASGMRRRATLRRYIVAGMFPLIAAFAIVPAYQRVVYNPAYFAEQGGRTFWHNVVIGFAHFKHFQDILVLDGSDKEAVRAVLRHAQKGEPSLDVDGLTSDALLALSGNAAYDWGRHEEYARSLTLHMAKHHSAEFIHMVFVTKPALVLSYFSYLFDPNGFLEKYSHSWSHGRRVLQYFGYATVALIMLAAAFRPSRQDLRVLAPVIIICGSMFAGLFAVPVIFYPMITTIAGSFFYACLTLFVFATVGLYWLYDKIRYRWFDPRMRRESS